jgi:hypothetical protein
MMFHSSIIVFIVALLTINEVDADPGIKMMRAMKDTVGLYEKFEIMLDLNSVYENPYDPDQIDITCIFTSPSGDEWKIFGFYNQSWFPWMIRFSANEIGEWTYIIITKDKSGIAESEPGKFFVNESEHHGPIRIAQNKRYLEYEDGTTYYGIGLWFNGAMYSFRGERESPEYVLNELKNLKVNFISTILPPIETIGTGVGRYDSDLCRRVDELLNWLEERDMILSLNLWFHSFLSETIWPGFNKRWYVNPYQFVCKAKDFYSDKKAWKYQEKLYRYMIARWGYSRALGIWFVIDEVNGTDGWAKGDSLGAAKWGKNVHDFFKENDPYRHLTTGTRSGGVQEWWPEGYEVFDLAAREIYEAQGFPIIEDGKIDPEDENPLRSNYMNYITEIRKLWNGFEKPAIIGETGWDHTFYEPNMPGYLAMYHNVIWASLANGLSMTPFWWAYSDMINDNVVTKQMTSIANFTKNIPFNKLTNLKPVDATSSNGDVFVMNSDQLAFGWIVNPNADVTDAEVTVNDMADGTYNLRIYHTWRGQFIQKSEVLAKNETITFKVPRLVIEDSHARYVGQDIAFILSLKK